MHWPENLFLAYTFLTISAIGVYDTFQEPGKVIDRQHRNMMTAVFKFSALFFVCLCFVRVIAAFMQNKPEVGLLRRCELNRSIGFFLISLCGIIPRVLSYFVDDVFETDFILVTLSLLFASIIYLFFVCGTHKYCTHDKTVSNRIFQWNISIQLTTLVVSLLLVIIYCDESRKTAISLYQIVFFGLCLAGIQELLEIYNGGLKLKQENRNREELKSVKVGDSKKGREFSTEVNKNNKGRKQGVKLVRQPVKLECKICMLEYSQPSRIPRILKECGHTLCEKCVDKLLKKAHIGNHIFCPLCQAVTVVHGPASTLPKNYETMATMDI